MATLNEIVGVLSERVGRAFDIPFQEELKILVHIARAKLIKDSFQKRSKDRIGYLQSFVAPVTQVHKVECIIPFGCTLRTVDKIPTPIRGSGILFDYVGSADFDLPFSLGGDWKERYLKDNKYTGNRTRYTFRDEYIFISDRHNAIELIGIIGLFEDPTSISKFKCDSSDGDCYSDDKEYPIPGDLLDPLMNSILQTKLNFNIPNKETEVKVDPRNS